jgi:glycosyltransferase involved in cell wall biosynthesis
LHASDRTKDWPFAGRLNHNGAVAGKTEVPKTVQGNELIDIVMPAFNEAQGIARTIETLFRTLRTLPYRFELIVVDDGSADATAEIVQGFQDRLPIKLVQLSRNFGKETALLAGLDQACGEATIIMDADLQHPVGLVGEFLASWRNGYDCVYAVKRDREGESLIKRFLVGLFYRGVNRGSNIQIPPNALDFRLLDRRAVDALRSLRERVRFTKGLYAWLGFRSLAVPIVPPPREDGKSRFDMSALVRLGWDGLTSFSDLPLRAAGAVGLVVALWAIAYGIWITLKTLIFGIDVPGWATITVILSLIGGIQLMFLGVLGQYVRSVFIETKRRPNYLVSEFTQSELCVSRRGPESFAEAPARRSGKNALIDVA